MKPTSIKRLYRPLERYYKANLLKPARLYLQYLSAKGYRYILGKGKTTFIGVTGSCGKTTATELIAAVLAKEYNVVKGSHLNTARYLAETILTVSPRHRFCVVEVSAACPGAMDESAKLLKPHIGVVTHIGQDHYGSYRNLEATAHEKGKLVEMLPADGTAILNADDPYVFEMRNRTKAHVITYGLSADVAVRGECVSCAWPTPMSLDIHYAQKRYHVQTKLLGEHWAYAVLAAFAAAIAAGVSPEKAVEAIEALNPTPYRMCPHTTPDGITFISDNWKSPLWTIPALMDFTRKADAPRKILIAGSISDTPRGFYDRQKTVIKQALGIVDSVIFVGEHAYSALRTQINQENLHVMAFATIGQLNLFLNSYLKKGDLVLLKGSEAIDHLQRIILSRTGNVTCWRKCEKRRFCSDCHFLYNSPANNALSEENLIQKR
jgi:UDP-N-acetylmuramoyl-tripeptide--D-alanyl-D-alanine ligase